MGKKLFNRRKGIDNHKDIQLKIEDFKKMSLISIEGWITPNYNVQSMNYSNPLIYRLRKDIKTTIFNALSIQDVYLKNLYIVDVNTSTSTLFLNERAFIGIEISLYSNSIKANDIEDEYLFKIINPVIDTILSSTNFNFKRHKK